MAFRFAVLISAFSLIYGGLVWKLYDVQLQNGSLYSNAAETQLRLAGVLEPVRGYIYLSDKHGDKIPVAMNADFPFVYAVPKELANAEAAAASLSAIVGRSADFLTSIFGKKNDPYEPLITKATKEQVDAVNELNIDGLYVVQHPARSYPLNNLASQVVGFVSANGSKDNRPQGQYGIESFYNGDLLGKEGAVDGDVVKSSEAGKDIVLTIDRNIQARAENILGKLTSEHDAPSGSFIVEEPKTGKILAMGGLPGFDPNNYGGADIKNFLNPNVQGVYEPGSIFKVITMATGIDSGAITPDTTYYDAGSVKMNGRTISNWDYEEKGAHGNITMTQVIEQSVNTGAIFAEKQIGHKTFYDYLKKFGLKELTKIDLPGERTGSLAPMEVRGAPDVNFATASYGQGLSVTPIRLISAISALANGGILMRPYVNANLKPEVIRRAVSADAAKKVTDMMISAVDKAAIAKIPGYFVAGKTGTAYVPDFGKNRYTDQVINTYVGFAPASDPQFVILIKLDKPARAPLAGTTVVPAFRELAEFILSYYNVKPDRTEN